MRRYGNGIFSVILMGLLLWTLIQTNISSPRISADAVGSGTVLGERLILLEGGETVTDVQGRESYRFTLHWEGEGCLFMPKANNSALKVNGVDADDLASGQKRLFQFASDRASDGVYEVLVQPAGGTVGMYDTCVYLGTLPAVNACLSGQIISRYFATGVCFSIALFSLVLFGWKHSEKYLFWLALYAMSVMLRTMDRFGLTLPPFLGILYLFLNAYLSYQILKYYLPMELLGRPVIYYVLCASVLQLAGLFNQTLVNGTEILFHVVFNGCLVLCVLRAKELLRLDKWIISAAWVVTVTLRTFVFLSMDNKIPHGDVDLQIHIQAIMSCIYVIAFFIVACRRFAIKFQEADDLNAHLEAIVQEKTKEQSRFIRSMLHNLKTPLFSLVGYADMALASLDAPAEAERCLAKVSDKAQYVSGLLDHLFLLTQMDANQMVFQRVPVRLPDLLRAVEESARLKGKEKDVRVRLAAAPDAFCMGDPLYLQQAFQNIADNAVEHVEPAGSLDISLAAQGERWRITFTDDGCGIPAEELPKVFDRYYSNHHGKRSSSGLGLTIAKEIIEHHGGTITAENGAERGAVFTVELPGSAGEG